VRPVELDETPLPGESPRTMVLRLAGEEGALAAADASPGAPILPRHTPGAAAVAGRILGKPADAGEAADMLRRLSGRAHSVFTAVALRVAGDGDRSAEDGG